MQRSHKAHAGLCQAVGSCTAGAHELRCCAVAGHLHHRGVRRRSPRSAAQHSRGSTVLGSPSRAQPGCPGLLAPLLVLWVTPQLPDAAVAERGLRHVTAQHQRQLTKFAACNLLAHLQWKQFSLARASTGSDQSTMEKVCKAYLRGLPGLCSPGLMAA